MKKKLIFLTVLLAAVAVVSAGCGAASENMNVNTEVSETEKAEVTEELLAEETPEPEVTVVQTKEDEISGQDQIEKPAYAPIEPGVWVDQDRGIQFIFDINDNTGRTFDDQTGTGSPFAYKCTVDGYTFSFGGEGDETPAVPEFNSDGTLTLTFNYSDEKTVSYTLTHISSETEGMVDEGGSFLGNWGCGRATMKVTDGETGGRYVVEISWAESASKTNKWTYKCKYSEEEGGLVSDWGELRCEVFESEDSEPEVTVTDGQEAVFTIGDDGIKWNDKINNSGADMCFTK
ncbi:MAG: hypothetical protein MJ068_05115 [Clostridia bacterium]|nr:hypothetical protein [Clostridia bacterium]